MDMGAFSGQAQPSEGGLASLVRKMSIEGEILKQVIAAEEEQVQCFADRNLCDDELGSPTFAVE